MTILAAEAGLDASRFAGEARDGRADELCVLCGLCVRVCRDLVGAAAIAFTGRGQPFAPEPMAFLAGLAEASEHLWGLCPACRRREAAMALSASGSGRS